MTSGDSEEDVHPRRRWAAWVVGGLAVAILAIWRPLARGDEMHEFAGPTMGTTFVVSVDADLTEAQREQVRRVIDGGLDQVNGLMSTYDSTSQVSRFNDHASTTPFLVGFQVIEVLALANDVSEASGGAFDVTVAPLVDAWGFGASDQAGPLPDDARVAELRSFVGYEGLVVDRGASTVSKSDPRMRIDLSGIAQGYAADVVASGLAALGLSDYLVDIGGEIRAAGARRSGRPWRVGVESPDERVPVWGTVELHGEGVATSGDFRNWYEEGGARYAHIIDPTTGRPIPMRGASVTVVHENAALADAWATALCVLGPDRGYEVAVREGLAAVFIVRAEGGPESLVTPAMEDRIAVAPPSN